MEKKSSVSSSTARSRLTLPRKEVPSGTPGEVVHEASPPNSISQVRFAALGVDLEAESARRPARRCSR